MTAFSVLNTTVSYIAGMDSCRTVLSTRANAHAVFGEDAAARDKMSIVSSVGRRLSGNEDG